MSRCCVGAVTSISLCMQIVRGWGMSRDLKSGGTTAWLSGQQFNCGCVQRILRVGVSD